MKPVDPKRERIIRNARENMKSRKPAEWKQAIDRLPCGRVCRTMAACIVWWDYFAKKPAVPHDATLDGYKNDWDYMIITGAKIRIRAESLVRALVALGYVECVARDRASVISGPGKEYVR